jgi:hypothetical protein
MARGKMVERKERVRGARAVGVVQLQQPPVLQGTPTLSHTFRFVATATAVNAVTYAGIAAIGPCVCDVANNTLIPIASSVKIRKVEVWTPAAAAGEASANVVWLANAANQFVPDGEKLRTTLGSATPGYLISRPPRKTFVADWFNPSGAPNTEFLSISCPASSIVDVTLSFRLSNELATTGRAVSTAALGSIYYMALDNAVGAGTHNLVPYGLPTTF